MAIGGGILYGLIVILVVRPLLHPLQRRAEQHGTLTGPMLALILTLLMFPAWFTDRIGIYAVFGAFILGAAMPRGVVTRDLQERIEPLATNFLLPLFFIYSGLNTQLGLVSPELWGLAVLVILAATAGKGIACTAAARLGGENWREAMAIGTLMNARGLMELILLNIGLERGFITPTLFSIMVTMAIVTTLLTSPIFERIYGRDAPLASAIAVAAGPAKKGQLP